MKALADFKEIWLVDFEFMHHREGGQLFAVWWRER